MHTRHTPLCMWRMLSKPWLGSRSEHEHVRKVFVVLEKGKVQFCWSEMRGLLPICKSDNYRETSYLRILLCCCLYRLTKYSKFAHKPIRTNHPLIAMTHLLTHPQVVCSDTLSAKLVACRWITQRGVLSVHSWQNDGSAMSERVPLKTAMASKQISLQCLKQKHRTNTTTALFGPQPGDIDTVNLWYIELGMDMWVWATAETVLRCEKKATSKKVWVMF